MSFESVLAALKNHEIKDENQLAFVKGSIAIFAQYGDSEWAYNCEDSIRWRFAVRNFWVKDYDLNGKVIEEKLNKYLNTVVRELRAYKEELAAEPEKTGKKIRPYEVWAWEQLLIEKHTDNEFVKQMYHNELSRIELERKRQEQQQAQQQEQMIPKPAGKDIIVLYGRYNAASVGLDRWVFAKHGEGACVIFRRLGRVLNEYAIPCVDMMLDFCAHEVARGEMNDGPVQKQLLEYKNALTQYYQKVKIKPKTNKEFENYLVQNDADNAYVQWKKNNEMTDQSRGGLTPQAYPPSASEAKPQCGLTPSAYPPSAERSETSIKKSFSLMDHDEFNTQKLSPAEFRQSTIDIPLAHISGVRPDIERQDPSWAPEFFRLFFEAFAKLKSHRDNAFYIQGLLFYLFALDLNIHKISRSQGTSVLRAQLMTVQDCIWNMVNALSMHDYHVEENQDKGLLFDLGDELPNRMAIVKLGTGLSYDQFMNIFNHSPILVSLCNDIMSDKTSMKKDCSCLIRYILELHFALMADIMRDPTLMRRRASAAMVSADANSLVKIGSPTIIERYADYVKIIVEEGPASSKLTAARDAVLNHPDYYKISERSKYAFLQCIVVGLLIGAVVSTVVVLLACTDTNMALHMARLVNDPHNILASTAASITFVGAIVGWGWSASRKTPLSLDIKTTEFDVLQKKADALRPNYNKFSNP